MNRSQLYLGIAVFLVLFGVVLLLQYKIFLLRKDYKPIERLLDLPEPQFLKILSLGFHNVLADAIWIMATQFFGGHFTQLEPNYRSLSRAFWAIVTLDPYFRYAYEFAIFVLCETGTSQNFFATGMPDENRELTPLQKWIQRDIKALGDYCAEFNHDYWRLIYQVGFSLAYYFNDLEGAIQYFKKASRMPGCDGFVERMIPIMQNRLGRRKVAIAYWENYLAKPDLKPHEKEIALTHYRSLLADEIMEHLENLRQEYERRTGKRLTHLNELLTAKLLDNIPDDPRGGSFLWVEEWNKIAGTYDLAQGRENNLLWFALHINNFIHKYGRPPESLEELIKVGAIEEIPSDPFGGNYEYNPGTGEVYPPEKTKYDASIWKNWKLKF